MPGRPHRARRRRVPGTDGAAGSTGPPRPGSRPRRGSPQRRDDDTPQQETGVGAEHDAVDDRDHPRRRQRQLPARWARPPPSMDASAPMPRTMSTYGASSGGHRHVEVPQATDAPRIRHVLERQLDQTRERHGADEGQHGQDDERERIERRPEPRHLADERERDEAARERRQVDRRAPIGFADRRGPRRLQVEVFGGRERNRRPDGGRRVGTVWSGRGISRR